MPGPTSPGCTQMFKLLVILLFLIILASLGSSLFFMIKDKGKTTRPVKALTLRISASVALFLLLIAGYFGGLIQPHGLYPRPPAVETPGTLPE